MKKIIISLLITLNITFLYSQDFFTVDDRYVNFDRALLSYNNSISELVNLFTPNNAIKILLGEKDLLDQTLDIFSLAQLDNSYLRLLRNMIFARHGLRFNSSDLNIYFSRFGWYTPRATNVDNLLTQVDRYNIQMIQAFESRNENTSNIVWGNNRVGVWDHSIAMAAGWSDRFVIHSTNQMEFYFSQMRGLPLCLGMNGTYLIKGNVLEFHVRELFLLNNGSITTGLNGYEWEQSGRITISFQNPIIYKFPITAIHRREYGNNGQLVHDAITIGGINFHRFDSNVNNKF